MKSGAGDLTNILTRNQQVIEAAGIEITPESGGSVGARYQQQKND